MEKVMYDIYLAEAEIKARADVFYSDSALKQDLLNSVLKKHKISEATLDTSLVWYSGRLERYFKITDKVSKRFAKEIETIKRMEEMNKKMSSDSVSNIFALPLELERFFLKSSDLRNNAYTFKSDTTMLRYGGAYELHFNILGVTGFIHPVVTFCVQGRDTTFVKRDTITWNGLFVSSINIGQEKQTNEIYGSIYFPNVYPEMTVFIENFTLLFNMNANLLTQPPK